MRGRLRRPVENIARHKPSESVLTYHLQPLCRRLDGTLQPLTLNAFVSTARTLR